ncbi:hypothetical protein ILUMI_11446 [Ignelater luminosus]|uniref:Tyrosine specific protein phosphatases domain-containing protein n=1 Tax=Ignelater luminosus TaxID=2038154 RepID=A0A8K0D0G3_IGNLU|nr:hypothetical protein ILUMI_11446 [Ignelater luminosus]
MMFGRDTVATNIKEPRNINLNFCIFFRFLLQSTTLESARILLGFRCSVTQFEPINDRTEDADAFYDTLIRECEKISRHGLEAQYRNISGRCSLHEATSPNGERLYQLTELQNMMISSTYFNHKKPVGVHCRMGRGRTGVMVACYLVRFHDMAPERAINKVRIQRPGSVETRTQERAVLQYHDHLRRNEPEDVDLDDETD